jgi:Circadian oscillating protein COP23
MQLHQPSYYLINSNIVKTIWLSTLATVTGSVLTTVLPVGANPQTIAQNEAPTIQLYCGKAADASSRTTLPATVAKISGSTEEPVLIIWKSEAFGNFTPQKRCETVSPKFQAALQQGRNYLIAGIDKKSGVGIVCATKSPDQVCDRTNMLFTLKSYQAADTTIQEISDLFAGKSGAPSYQSSNGKPIVDLRNLSLLLQKK